jgi:hypothetical protein
LKLEGAGLVVRLGEIHLVLPIADVAFVAPIRNSKPGRLELPRGELELTPLASRVGMEPSGTEASAVVLRGPSGFVAFAVDSVDFAAAGTVAPDASAVDVARLLE